MSEIFVLIASLAISCLLSLVSIKPPIPLPIKSPIAPPSGPPTSVPIPLPTPPPILLPASLLALSPYAKFPNVFPIASYGTPPPS